MQTPNEPVHKGAISRSSAKCSAELNTNRAAALFYKINLDNKDTAGSELTETAPFFFFLPQLFCF